MEDPIHKGQGVFVTGAGETIYRFEGGAREGFVTLSAAGGLEFDVPEDCIRPVKKSGAKPLPTLGMSAG